MRPVKSVFGVMAAIVPVGYCGWLLYYFLDLSGSVQEAEAIGLGPTVLGLGAIGLLLSIPLILKVIRLFAGRRPPGSGGPSIPEEEFDADAVIARYRTQQSVPDAPRAPPAPLARKAGGPVRPTSFGRRTR